MMKEKDLKEKGEKLAEIAVEDGLGSKQLTTLYKLAKTRPVPFIEVFIKRQMGRDVEGGSSTRGFGKVKMNFEKVHERSAKYYLGEEEEKVLEGEALQKWLREKGGL